MNKEVKHFRRIIKWFRDRHDHKQGVPSCQWCSKLGEMTLLADEIDNKMNEWKNVPVSYEGAIANMMKKDRENEEAMMNAKKTSK